MTRYNPGYTPYFDPEDALTSTELTFIQDLSEDAGGDATAIPVISTGTSAPGTTPANVGDVFVDTSNDKVYVASGTASSSDWTEVTGGGGGGSLTVEEGDGSPSVSSVSTIVFPNGSVTDDGSGQVTISLAGSGDVTAASNFGNDNRLIRSDGTGKGVQASGITINDSDAISGASISGSANTITNLGTSSLSNDAVTFDKIQNVPTNRVLARDSAGTGSVEALTLPDFRTLINVEDGATAITELNDVSDVSLSSVSNKEVLEYDGSNFVNVISPDYKVVYNNTGGTLTEGTMVHITGSAGGFPLVTVADKDSDAEVSGILIEDISAATTGLMQVQGTIQETFINTLGMTAGDPLYLGDNGAYTDTKPTSGNVIQIGVVGVVASSSGSILLDCPATTLNIGENVFWETAGDIADRSAAPASGDKLILFEAGVGMRKIDWDDLPGGGSGDAWGDAVDADIVPTGADSTYDIGTSSDRFANAYFDYVDTSSLYTPSQVQAPSFAGLSGLANIDIDGSDIVLTADGSTGTVNLVPSGSGEAQVNGERILDETDLASPTFTGTTTNDDVQINGHVYADGVVDNGNSGTSETIDWGAGNMQKSTLTGNCTFTFTAPDGPGRFDLELVQDGTGSRTVTWPASVRWPGGTAPTLSTAANAVDIITFRYNGTNYDAVESLNFS